MSDGRSLSGLKVVELGHRAAGPVRGRVFADHGADVIKVEPPSGDAMRRWGRLYDGVGLHWSYVARGKSSVVIDLSTPEGQEQLKGLLADADVVIENFRPRKSPHGRSPSIRKRHCRCWTKPGFRRAGSTTRPISRTTNIIAPAT
ncbi:CoA transferase [Streptomyces blattellae]|uniref:CoA transferase n=1 Tax=Streptomyces blattellae TaxID=2569855 RepID=UPI001E52336E|nr:CoA transferase [Streptomyces blattellae]